MTTITVLRRLERGRSINKEQRFFIYRHCDNLVGMIFSSGIPMVYCGERMAKLVANMTDAVTEKYVPAVTVEGDTVIAVIDSVEHPMLPEHYIQWIYLLATAGGHHTALQPGEAPKAVFILQDGEKPIVVCEYCNLYGL